MADELWTISAASRACSLDRATIRTRLTGIPPDGRVGRYDAWLPSTVMAAICSAAEVPAERLDAERERAGLLRAQRLKTEFEVGILNGKYVSVDEVEATDAVMFTALRDRIRNVVSCAPLAHQAALQEGEIGLRRVLAKEIDAALEEIGTAELVAMPADA